MTRLAAAPVKLCLSTWTWPLAKRETVNPR
jgi:hypothetical protein